MSDQQLETLEQKIDDLLHMVDYLNKENQALRLKKSTWQEERSQLIKKNELARSKIEAMIDRLKSLEQENLWARP